MDPSSISCIHSNFDIRSFKIVIGTHPSPSQHCRLWVAPTVVVWSVECPCDSDFGKFFIFIFTFFTFFYFFSLLTFYLFYFNKGPSRALFFARRVSPKPKKMDFGFLHSNFPYPNVFLFSELEQTVLIFVFSMKFCLDDSSFSQIPISKMLTIFYFRN